MQERLAITQKFLDALKVKDIDHALTFLADDIVAHSPMGKKRGKEKVRGMLKLVANVGGGNAKDLQLAGENVTALVDSPIGQARLTFHFAGEQIQEVAVKLGV